MISKNIFYEQNGDNSVLVNFWKWDEHGKKSILFPNGGCAEVPEMGMIPERGNIILGISKQKFGNWILELSKEIWAQVDLDYRRQHPAVGVYKDHYAEGGKMIDSILSARAVGIISYSDAELSCKRILKQIGIL